MEWVKRITRAAAGDHPSWTCRPHHSLEVYSTVCALCGSGYSCHFLGADFGQQNAGLENYWQFCTDTTVNITVLVCGPYQIFTNTDVPSSGRCVSLKYTGDDIFLSLCRSRGAVKYYIRPRILGFTFSFAARMKTDPMTNAKPHSKIILS